MFAKILYLTGFVVAVLFIVFSLDDIILDIYYYMVGRYKVKGRLSIKDLDDIPARLLAVMIPAWNENKVIGPMVENLLQSITYPLSFVHIFLGVYPNDTSTCQAAETLAAKYPNVHPVINCLPGPTSKAQNLNNVLKFILDFERDNRLRFAALIIHDAEDVVHPTSFKLANYLTYNGYEVVQLPVFPLQPYPTWRTFFKFITAATYADEFADNHYRGLPAREASGAFVPSAGTGFIISRRVLGKIGNFELFEEESMTEDYRLSLRFKELGIHVHFFIEGVQRVLENGKIVVEYVATREIFPNTFREAVRQKSRWIYGISFQSFSYFKVLKNKSLSRITKYSLYRDWKAKFGNLLTLPGYAVFVYAIASLFTSLPPVYPIGAFSWYLCVALTFMMAERQVMRCVAIKNVYGWRSAVVACFVPPLMQLRIVWGNVINFFATVVAWRIAFFGFPKKRPRWQKTEHSYLAPEILARYRRKLGDLVLERELLEPKALFQAIKEAKANNELLGATLARLEMVPRIGLVKALGENLKIGYVRLTSNQTSGSFPPKVLDIFEKNMVAPVALTATQAVIAAREPLPEKTVREISSCLDGRSITLVLAPEEDIAKQLSIIKNSSMDKEARRIGEVLLEYGKITSEQLLQALRVQELNRKPLGQILVEMGVVLGEDLDLFLTSTEFPQDHYVVQAAPAIEEKELIPNS